MVDFNNQLTDVTSPSQQDGEIDHFDLLPDPIVVSIFNRILDAKSLCRCLVVSKRFASLVPQIDSLSVQLSPEKSTQDSRSRSKRNLFRGLFSKVVAKSFQFLNQMLGKKLSPSSSKDDGFDVFEWIGTALKNFNEVQTLKLQLPCYGGEIGANRTIPLLRWDARFGKNLQRCVILGATSISDRKEKVARTQDPESDQNGEEEEEQSFTDEELKLRIIWIVSCLIASSARHSLLKKVVSVCPKLSNAEISDAGKQGKLGMNAAQIKELRDSMDNPKPESESESQVGSTLESPGSASHMEYTGNLVMKLWYVKELELKGSGKVLKGATMVVIRPDGKLGPEDREKKGGAGGGSGGAGAGGGDGLSLPMKRAFEGDEVFGEAARELVRRKERRVYRLEMNTI